MSLRERILGGGYTVVWGRTEVSDPGDHPFLVRRYIEGLTVPCARLLPTTTERRLEHRRAGKRSTFRGARLMSRSFRRLPRPTPNSSEEEKG